MKALKKAVLFSLVIGLFGLGAYWNWIAASANDDNSQRLAELKSRLESNNKKLSESEQVIELWVQDSQGLENAIRKNASSARMKDLLIIYGLQEIADGQDVRRVYQYDNRKYLTGWFSYEPVTDELLGQSVFKYNNQGYLIEWHIYQPADIRIRMITFQYDSSGYLTECIAETVYN